MFQDYGQNTGPAALPVLFLLPWLHPGYPALSLSDPQSEVPDA